MKNSALKAFAWIMLIAILIACLPALLEAIGVALAILAQIAFIAIFAYVVGNIAYGACELTVELANHGATDEPVWKF